MADLLECVLQIKGLRETIDRINALVANADCQAWTRPSAPDRPAPVDLLARLAEIEVVNGVCLRLMLSSPHPVLPVVREDDLLSLARSRQWNAATARERFIERRRDNLEILDRCTADDLSRKGVHPERRDITVADLVAVMLATDAEHVGEIRRALGA